MRSIQVPAGVIEYDEVGSGPPVVLLHGVLMDHTLRHRGQCADVVSPTPDITR